MLSVDGDKLVIEDTTTKRRLQNVNAELIDPYMYGFSANVVLTHTERRYGSGKRLREENVKLKKQNKKLKTEKVELQKELKATKRIVKNMQTQLNKLEEELSSFELCNIFPSMHNTREKSYAQ